MGPVASGVKSRRAAAADSDKVLVQVRLPKALVRQLDHVGVDQERNRSAMVEAAVRTFLATLHGPHEERDEPAYPD